MEEYVLLKTFSDGKNFFTQNFVEAQRYLESGKSLTAYLEMSDGTMQTSTIISINEDELSFITKSGDEYLVKGIDNKINEIIVTSFYNKTKNEVYDGTDISVVMRAFDNADFLQAIYYVPKRLKGISARIVRLDFEKHIFMIETGTMYHFLIDAEKD